MGRRNIEFALDYFDKETAEIKTEILYIDFVSNKCRRAYNEIVSGASDVQRCFNDMNHKMSEIASLKKEKPKNYKSSIRDLQKEIKILISKIKQYEETQLLERRFEIIKIILEQNNIKDEKFFNFEFWDEYVDPSDAIDFLDQCVFKDIDKKKR